MSNTVQINVRLPKDLHDRLRARSLSETIDLGTVISLSTIVCRAVERELDRPGPKERRRCLPTTTLAGRKCLNCGSEAAAGEPLKCRLAKLEIPA